MSKVLYTEEHEWLKIDGDTAMVGITDYAQNQLGDLVFVDLPEVGAELEKDGDCAVVESVKAASDVYAPIDGEVTKINDALEADASMVNSDAEGTGWIWEMTIADASQLDDLMDKAAYDAFTGA